MTDDERAQAFVDTGKYSAILNLTPWLSITKIPVRIPNTVSFIACEGCTKLTSIAVGRLPESVRFTDFNGCTSLMSVAGLPEGVTDVFFDGCTYLTSVAGLPQSVTCAHFRGCTSLTSVAGLPQSVRYIYFDRCTSLTSVMGLPQSFTYANFTGCTRLRRVKLTAQRYHFDDMFDPARDVHALMVSGISDKLLSNKVGIGPDIALLIGRFVTPGISKTDRMETLSQVQARYNLKTSNS